MIGIKKSMTWACVLAAFFCSSVAMAQTSGVPLADGTEPEKGFVITKPDPEREKRPIKIELAEEPALVLGSMKITLGQAMIWAVRQNFDMMSVSYDVAMVDTHYNQFLKKFAPVLSAEGGGSFVKFPPSQSTFAGKNAISVDGTVSLYKNFSSGTTLAAGLSHQYQDIQRGGGMASLFSGSMGPANVHRPSVFVSVQQELVRNAFGINDRRLEEILKNSAKMRKEGILFQLSLVIVQVIGEYWNTVITKVSLENAELQVKETKKVRDITARNAAYGLADRYTLNMYNSMLAGAEAKLVLTRQKYREALRSFLSTINVDDTTDVTGIAVFSNRYPEINIEEALSTAYKKRADYAIAVMSLDNAKMGERMAENSSLPSIIAEINAAAQGEKEKIAASYGDIGMLRYPAVEGKLKLSYPIGDKDLYTQERNARFKVRQAEIQLEKYRRKVKDDIMNVTDGIENGYKLYQKATEARKQSELFYRGMLRDLGLGRLNSAVVKNGLDALVQSREMELQALVGYNIALLQYDVARNILFEKYGIDVEQYIPRDTGRAPALKKK
ncbi:MAG: TolC family protein [Spirochaetes bacterium]|nr:TolC family protein [Spirochaetota bacterium]